MKRGKLKAKPVVAIAQIRYVNSSRKNNADKIKRYIRKAKKAGADIVCFPESCVHKTEVFHKNHKVIKEICDECRKNSIWCILTEDIKSGKRKYNTSMLIDRKGKIVGDYKKIHLYGDEGIKAGSRMKVFKTDFGKIGIALCWDLAFPDMFKKMRDKGAEIVFCPSQWEYEPAVHDKEHVKREVEILESLILARAFENLYFVALCNPVVESKYQVSYSGIVSPHKVLKRIVGKEGMIVAKLNLNEIYKNRKVYG